MRGSESESTPSKWQRWSGCKHALSLNLPCFPTSFPRPPTTKANRTFPRQLTPAADCEFRRGCAIPCARIQQEVGRARNSLERFNEIVDVERRGRAVLRPSQIPPFPVRQTDMLLKAPPRKRTAAVNINQEKGSLPHPGIWKNSLRKCRCPRPTPDSSQLEPRRKFGYKTKLVVRPNMRLVAYPA